MHGGGSAVCLSLANLFVFHVQLLPTGVQVRIAYPPDTDTPGYAQENVTKVDLLNP